MFGWGAEPINCWDSLVKVLLCFFESQAISVTVDAASFLESRNSPVHPLSITSKLIVGSKDWPVHGELERNEAVNSADGLSIQVCLGQRRRVSEAAIGVTI